MTKETRPTALPVAPQNIPDSLRAIPGWLLWKYEIRKGEWTKPPYSPTGHLGSSTNQDTWSPFAKVLRAYARPSHLWDGIGISLDAEAQLCGADLDYCIDPITGEIAEWALAITRRLRSYTERSPSGEGLRIFFFAKLPPEGRKQGKIEIYETGRYLTVTGRHLESTPPGIEERTSEVAAWHAETFTEPEKPSQPEERPTPAPLDLSDQQILEVARNAKNGADIDRLLRGDWDGRYESQSEADSALCMHLGFYVQGDPVRVDRLFRSSGMMRSKWDEPHYAGGKLYGEGTVERALRVLTEYWTPPSSYRRFDAANRNGKTVTEQEGESPEVSVSVPIYLETDTGNAERLQYQHGRDLRYCHPWRKWLVWNETRWVLDATAEAERRAISTAKSLWKEVAVEEDAEKKKRLVKHALLSESKDRIRGMLTVLGMLSGVPVLPNELDRDPWLICCLNGTINLRAGRLQKTQRKHMMTKQVPVEFDADAECPLWEEFLGKIFNKSEDMIAFIQRAVGYSLTGTVRERCFFVCHGEGANGKSTFFDVIGSMLGDYSHRTPTETLLMRREDALTNDLAALMGKRFVFASESEEDRRLAVSRIKDMTGRDKITARFLHQEFFTFEPEFKLWLATNHRPRITDTNRAIWDRIRLIPFNITIPRHEQDADLPEKLKEEWSGILAWAVRGCLEWQTDGLAEPDEVLKATESYRQAEDVVDGFVQECIELDDSKQSQVNPTYQRYVAWCSGSGEKPLGRRKFNERLHEKGFDSFKDTDGRFYWIGFTTGDAPEEG